jgi:hypothetical protein
MHRVIWWILTEVLEDFTAFFISVVGGNKLLSNVGSPETVLCHIQEDSHFHYKNLFH